MGGREKLEINQASRCLGKRRGVERGAIYIYIYLLGWRLIARRGKLIKERTKQDSFAVLVSHLIISKIRTIRRRCRGDCKNVYIRWCIYTRHVYTEESRLSRRDSPSALHSLPLITIIIRRDGGPVLIRGSACLT